MTSLLNPAQTERERAIFWDVIQQIQETKAEAFDHMIASIEGVKKC
jgi:hypothetical protein